MDSRLLGLGPRSLRIYVGERHLACAAAQSAVGAGLLASSEWGLAWVSGYWGDIGMTTEDLLPPPPDPVDEPIPPQPDNNSIYVPGIWVFQQNQYLWQPGHWITGQPGWVWTPAFYCWSPGGYIFVSGFWDHDLDQRG